MSKLLCTQWYFVIFFIHAKFSLSYSSSSKYIRDSQPCFNFICGSDYYPVCGSDGETYANPCKFIQAQCKNPKLTVFLQGSCADLGGSVNTENSVSSDVISPTTDVCGITEECSPEIYDPVCGSNGKTYSNDCFFTLAYCQNKGLSVASKGECSNSVTTNEKCPTKICPFEEDALCASNGKTYRNYCEFEQVKCYRRDLAVLYKGKCKTESEGEEGNCEWECNEKQRSVCGTDDQTYKNMCEFERAQCRNKGKC